MKYCCVLHSNLLRCLRRTQRTGLGFHTADAMEDRQDRTTYHHEFVGLDNRDKPRSKQVSVMSFFGKAAAPAAKAAGVSGSGATPAARASGGSGATSTQPSKWQPAPPVHMLPPPATTPAPEEARAAAGAAAGAAPRGQARAPGVAADGDVAPPKAVRRIR